MKLEKGATKFANGFSTLVKEEVEANYGSIKENSLGNINQDENLIDMFPATPREVLEEIPSIRTQKSVSYDGVRI